MPKEGRIISHLRLFIPKYRDEIPFKDVLEWAEKVYKKACAKSGKPIRLSDDEFWKDKADIARAFRQGLKRAYETVDGVPAKRILEKLPLKSAERAREMVFDQWSSVGPGGPAAILAGRWLSGNKTVLQFLRENNPLYSPFNKGDSDGIKSPLTKGAGGLYGEPILITEPKRAGQFRKQLQTLLVKLTGIISDANFMDEEVKDAEGRIDKLVRGFIKDGLEVSVKFVLVPESITPADSTEVLDKKYEINEFFYGAEYAKARRAECIEKKYLYPLNPDDYIGNPDKPAYFDMYLDIQISRK